MTSRRSTKRSAVSRPGAFEPLEARQLFSGGSLVPGGIVHGIIGTPGQHDLWTFQGHRNDIIRIGMNGSGAPGFDAYAQFYKPGGSSGDPIRSFFSVGSLQVALEADGIYTVDVHDSNDQQTGDYNISLEGIAPPSPDPIPLPFGAVTPGTIDASLDVKEYTFDAPAGSIITLGMTSSGPAGFDGYAELFDSAGASIASFFQRGQFVVPRLERGGTYTLAVHDSNYQQTGSFTIGIEGIVAPSPDAGKLVLGGIVSGHIASALDVKEYLFDVADQAIITLGMTSSGPQGFDAFAHLYNATSGEEVVGFFQRGQTSVKPLAAGTYMLYVSDSNFSQSGDFSIGMEGIKPISPNPIALVPGGRVSGSITAPLDVKEFVFQGKAGQIIDLALAGTATLGDFDAYAEFYAPSGTLVRGFFQGGGIEEHLKETGQYMLFVHDSNYADQGTVTIGLEGLNPISPGSVQLKPGGILKGAIDGRIDVDELTFQGKDGDLIDLAATCIAKESGFTARFDVYAPSGESVGSFFAGGQHPFPLKETGTYMIQVQDSDYANRGQYTIGLESRNPRSPDARALTPGVVHSGQISSPIGVDQFFLYLRAGQKVDFTLTSTATVAGFSAYAQICDQSGEVVWSFFAPGTSYTPKTSGMYLVQVHDSNFGQTGKYTLVAKPGKSKDATIFGKVYNDLNHNGRQDANEPGIAGATAYIDANNNQKANTGETTTTDSDGAFAFWTRRAGSYVVRLLRPSGYSLTGTPSVVATVKAGQNFNAGNFAAAVNPSISGGLIADDNKNKKLDNSIVEDTLYGWTVFIDLDKDGKYDRKKDRIATTDCNGKWCFTDMAAGTYTILVKTASPWKATTKPIKVTLPPGQSSVGNLIGVARVA